MLGAFGWSHSLSPQRDDGKTVPWKSLWKKGKDIYPPVACFPLDNFAPTGSKLS